MTRATRRAVTTLLLAASLPLVSACSTPPKPGGESGQSAGRQMYSPDVHVMGKKLKLPQVTASTLGQETWRYNPMYQP